MTNLTDKTFGHYLNPKVTRRRWDGGCVQGL